MDLSRYVETIEHELAVAAEVGGPDARALAERLTAPLASAVQLALLDALSAAAAEITRDLAPGSVEVRLRGREPSFVVTIPPPADAIADQDSDNRGRPTASDPDDRATARVNLRLPEDLKGRVEEAARRSDVSVNTWLVRAAADALGSDGRDARAKQRGRPGGDSFTGWVR